MNNKKKYKGGVSFNIMVDKESGEIEEEYFWREDREQPPLIKPRKRPENDSKRRSKPS